MIQISLIEPRIDSQQINFTMTFIFSTLDKALVHINNYNTMNNMMQTFFLTSLCNQPSLSFWDGLYNLIDYIRNPLQ